MKYRVLFVDPDDSTAERPVQMLTNSWLEAERWRDNALATATGSSSYVKIYETVEKLVDLKQKPKPEVKEASA